jgi:hypothetical protein
MVGKVRLIIGVGMMIEISILLVGVLKQDILFNLQDRKKNVSSRPYICKS